MTYLFASLILQPSSEVPKVVQRKEVPYVSMRATVEGKDFGNVVPKLMPKLGAWMAEHKIEPKGPLLIRYNYVDMPKRLDVEVGLITHSKVKASGDVISGVIPAGRYGSYTHFGDYSELVAANGKVQDFAHQNHLGFKMRKGDHGEEFVGRFELYETDPDKEPDKSKWETQVLYLVK